MWEFVQWRLRFCLLEADAVKPLVRLLEEEDSSVCEAALGALSTLLEGEMLQRGSMVIFCIQRNQANHTAIELSRD